MDEAELGVAEFRPWKGMLEAPLAMHASNIRDVRAGKECKPSTVFKLYPSARGMFIRTAELRVHLLAWYDKQLASGTSGKQIHRDTGISHVEWQRLRKGKVSRRATMKWAMAAGKITGDSSRRPADTYPALDKSSISAGKSKQPCRTAPAAR